MKLARVQLTRAVTISGLLGARDFITSEDALLSLDGSILIIETVLGGVTLVPIHNVLSMNAATAHQEKKETSTNATTITENEEVKQETAKPTHRGSSAAKHSGRPR